MGLFLALHFGHVGVIPSEYSRLGKNGSRLDEFYLKGNAEAFNKHLNDFWTKAVDWCAYFAIVFFMAGLTCTMVFVAKNFRQVNQMSNDRTVQQAMTEDLGKGLKPVGMTYVTDALKPAAMTPVVSGEDRGIKPAPMTSVPTQTPSAPVPAPPVQSDKK